MTLNAHSSSWCTRRQFFYNHSEKITEVYYAEMAEIFIKRVTGAAYVHVFHHKLCADRHNADGNGFNTCPAYAASYVARSFSVFSLLLGTQRTLTVCPTAGAQALTMSSLMTWYSCLSGQHCTAECRSRLCAFSLQKRRVQACRSFFT